MERHGLIAQIWGGDLTEDKDSMGSPLAGLLGSLMDVPVITLTSDATMQRPIAVMEETEVLPGASLGDVLSEELGIDVPYGVLVLIQPAGFAKSKDLSGQQLGEILGHIILEMTQGVHSVDATGEERAEDLMRVAMSGQIAPAVKLSGISGSRLQ